MSGEIIPWPDHDVPAQANVIERLEDLAALLRAIDAGELLAALPECSVARLQHTTALRLLAMAQRELSSICEDFSDAARRA